MVSVTLSVPEDIRKTMKDFPEINWSHIVREAIVKKAESLQIKKELLKEVQEEKEFSSWATAVVREGRSK
ncbi:MAG: hypothetical protein PF542_01415 [Nanoarchaeota archaeon]|nr:hypothetical protein [Nanoarchaeota archaeon]